MNDPQRRNGDAHRGNVDDAAEFAEDAETEGGAKQQRTRKIRSAQPAKKGDQRDARARDAGRIVCRKSRVSEDDWLRREEKERDQCASITKRSLRQDPDSPRTKGEKEEIPETREYQVALVLSVAIEDAVQPGDESSLRVVAHPAKPRRGRKDDPRQRRVLALYLIPMELEQLQSRANMSRFVDRG